MQTLPFGDPKTARVLVIGHDPRLQESDTVAAYAFFADYFFRSEPTSGSEKRKYGLANSVFSCINHLTAGKFGQEEFLITNLCNEVLPRAPKGKTVYIPESKATEGLASIRQLLSGSDVEVIFAMSLQVNYWLQKLNFYQQDCRFLEMAAPRVAGCQGSMPFYSPTKQKAFQLVCGRENLADGKFRLFPILHAKQWPLKGAVQLAYGGAYDACRQLFCENV